MNRSQAGQKRTRLPLLVAALFFAGTVPSLLAGSITDPGGGTLGDPQVFLGTVLPLGSTVTAGDVVVCAFGASCTGTPSANWIDVLVFYNPGNGPYVSDATGDATDVALFSTIDGSLTTFLSHYNTGSGGANDLSINFASINASDAAGDFAYGEYFFTAPRAAFPSRPASRFLLAGSSGWALPAVSLPAGSRRSSCR